MLPSVTFIMDSPGSSFVIYHVQSYEYTVTENSIRVETGESHMKNKNQSSVKEYIERTEND